MTYEQVQAQLSTVTYQQAIMYYALQKQNFISEYSRAIGDSSTLMGHQFIEDFIVDINSSQLQGQAFSLSGNLLSNLENALILAMEGKDFSSLQKVFQDSNKNYSDLTIKGKQQLANALSEILNLDIIHSELQKVLIASKLDNCGINPQDILSFSRGYLLASFYNKILGNSKYKGRKDILAGYFLEALVHKATGSLTQHLENKVTGSLQTGSQKISRGKHAIDTVFDEYFNFFSSDLNKTFVESININTNELTSGFGAQVKLWNPPWTIQRPKKFYSITTNSSIFNQWHERKSWIKGVKFLEDKVQQALGDNVMYILGRNFYWTCDLISDFRENQYYLAFKHSGEKFTGTVGWEQIDMSKPF